MPTPPTDSPTFSTEYYCPQCHRAVADPLVCSDCTAVICRVCGTPLEQVDELGIG